MKGAYGFKQQLAKGEIGEIIFLAAHQDDLVKLDGFKGDFALADGTKLELKTDMYDMERTPNFFVERYSDAAKKSPGGPWQAAAHGCTHFVYFYPKNLTYFTFDVAKLVGALEKLEPILEEKLIKNTSHTTMGYLVPRDLVAELATVGQLEVRKKV